MSKILVQDSCQILKNLEVTTQLSYPLYKGNYVTVFYLTFLSLLEKISGPSPPLCPGLFPTLKGFYWTFSKGIFTFEGFSLLFN